MLARGVPLLPDFVANGGSVAWAWWTLSGDITADAEDAFGKLSKQLGVKRGDPPRRIH